MRYAVSWSQSAKSELAKLWNDASDRAEVTAAANLMDAALALDPLECGESRQDEFRIMFAQPLAIEFKVNQDERMVRVVAIWRTSRDIR